MGPSRRSSLRSPVDSRRGFRRAHRSAARGIGARRAAVLVSVAGLLAGAACSDMDGSAEADFAEAEERQESTTTVPATPAVDGTTPALLETYGVGEQRFTWVDDSRRTAAHGGQPELPSRTLDVVVYAPEDGPGGFPLIVFGHGSSRAGDHYAGTLRAWASAGYVVVAPDFPLSSEGTPGGTKYDDVEAQTGDVSFLIDTAIADLGDQVDPERIGVAGQSFGAITALAVGFNACCADPRIDAVVAFAGTWLPLSQDVQDPRTTDLPLLMVHGEADDGAVSYASALETWRTTIDAPGAFITLTGSGHDDGFFDGPVDPRGQVVAGATVPFFDRWLKDDASPGDRVREAVEAAGPEVATVEER